MAYENKPGSGALFRNDKGDNPARPDYRGDCTLPDGTPAKLSAWLKEGKKGKFLSLKIEADGERGGGGGYGFRNEGSGGVSGGGGNRAKQNFDLDDDIPFVRPAGPFDRRA